MCEIYGIYAFCFQQQIYNYFFLVRVFYDKYVSV